MSNISLPYHLIIAALIFGVILAVLFYKRKQIFRSGKLKWFWISFTVFCVIYLILVGGAAYSDISSKLALQQFDLNGDGFFNGTEITSEQKTAMTNVISDTSSTLVIFTGLIFSGMISVLVFITGKIYEHIKLKKGSA
jgi:hypothetical protein